MSKSFQLKHLHRDAAQLGDGWREKVLYLCDRVKRAEDTNIEFKERYKTAERKLLRFEQVFIRLVRLTDTLWKRAKGMIKEMYGD